MGFLAALKRKKEKLKDNKRQLRKQELFLQIRELLAKEFRLENKENIKLESRFKEDLNLDSIDAIQVIMALERGFNFEIPDEDTEKVNTVGQIVDYILTRLK